MRAESQDIDSWLVRRITSKEKHNLDLLKRVTLVTKKKIDHLQNVHEVFRAKKQKGAYGDIFNKNVHLMSNMR